MVCAPTAGAQLLPALTATPLPRLGAGGDCLLKMRGRGGAQGTSSKPTREELRRGARASLEASPGEAARGSRRAERIRSEIAFSDPEKATCTVEIAFSGSKKATCTPEAASGGARARESPPRGGSPASFARLPLGRTAEGVPRGQAGSRAGLPRPRPPRRSDLGGGAKGARGLRAASFQRHRTACLSKRRAERAGAALPLESMAQGAAPARAPGALRAGGSSLPAIGRARRACPNRSTRRSPGCRGAARGPPP